MKEFGKPVILALRLKVENDKITEIEHVVARNISEKAMAKIEPVIKCIYLIMIVSVNNSKEFLPTIISKSPG